MIELLERLQAALPKIELWIDDLHARHRNDSVVASTLPFPRLTATFPADLLKVTRVASCGPVPFPPVSKYGLPEFETMANMPMAGITFRDLYFVDPVCGSESVHFHELVHVVQWRALGVRPFLLTYALGVLQHGYEQSPLEAIAFQLQTEFEQRTPGRSIVEYVTQHALRARDAAALVFRANGLEIVA